MRNTADSGSIDLGVGNWGSGLSSPPFWTHLFYTLECFHLKKRFHDQNQNQNQTLKILRNDDSGIHIWKIASRAYLHRWFLSGENANEGIRKWFCPDNFRTEKATYLVYRKDTALYLQLQVICATQEFLKPPTSVSVLAEIKALPSVAHPGLYPPPSSPQIWPSVEELLISDEVSECAIYKRDYGMHSARWCLGRTARRH